MALRWDFNRKCGEATFVRIFPDEEKEFVINLYEGNAYLIMLHEYRDEDEGKDYYELHSFFVDKAHAKRCLGLVKGASNIYDQPTWKLKRIKFNKALSNNYKDLIGLFAQAFDELVIEIENIPQTDE